MSSHRQSRLPVRALLMALMVVPPISILAAIPWLKQQPDGMVFLLSGVAAALTVVASFLFAILHDRRLDEWERSNARFSSQWGWTAGAGLVALLLALPAFRDWVVSLAADLADAANPDHKLVVLAFTFGFGGVVFAQGVCTALFSIGWAFWKSRATHEPS
jgi:hypothetical protein